MGNTSLINSKEYLKEYNWIPSYQIKKTITKKDYFNSKGNIDNFINNIDIYSYLNKSKPFEQVIDIIAITLTEEFKKSKIKNFIPSTRFLRDILIKTLNNYRRLSYLDLIQLIQHYGLVNDEFYKKNNFIIDNILLNESFKYKYIDFIGINDIHLIKSKIYERKLLIFGMSVTESFQKTEKEPLLKIDDTLIIGGVSGILIGFNEEKQIFILQLTKGDKWGDNGKIYLPYDFIINGNPEIYYLEIDDDLILSKNIIEFNNQINIKNDIPSGKWNLIGI